MLNNLGINESFFVMFAMFSLTYLFVSQVALKKLSRTLVEREHRTEGRQHEATVMNRDLEAIREKLQSSMQQARLQANAEFLQIRSKALDEQRNLITAARESAGNELKKSRASIQQQFAAEIKKLEEDIPKISKAILDKLLESPVVVRSSGETLSSGASGAE